MGTSKKKKGVKLKIKRIMKMWWMFCHRDALNEPHDLLQPSTGRDDFKP